MDWQIKSSLLADTFNLVGVSSNERPGKVIQKPRERKEVDESPKPALGTLSVANLKMLSRAIGERARCSNFVVLYPTKATLQRYEMITERRKQGLSESQLFTSLLYGPYPSTLTQEDLEEPRNEVPAASKDRDS